MVGKTIFNFGMRSGRDFGFVYDPETALEPDPRLQIDKTHIEIRKPGEVGMLLKVSEIESMDWRPAPVKKEKAEKATEEGENFVH